MEGGTRELSCIRYGGSTRAVAEPSCTGTGGERILDADGNPPTRRIPPAGEWSLCYLGSSHVSSIARRDSVLTTRKQPAMRAVSTGRIGQQGFPSQGGSGSSAGRGIGNTEGPRPAATLSCYSYSMHHVDLARSAHSREPISVNRLTARANAKTSSSPVKMLLAPTVSAFRPRSSIIER